ncbi:fructose-6-phosphate aldolase [Candidatus Calescamantes bacterium]|nr:fructose-6-phosphate aldolase [Candidatus Calescamantes bacterium]
MKFFLDTARIEEIKEALEWGVLDGVTTNPTHISATGKKFKEVAEEILSLVKGPVSLEVVSTEWKGMVEEAKELAKMGENVVIKIPLIREGVRAIKELTELGIKTNATLNFSLSQALMAAKAGATYVSPFVGRLDAVGEDGMGLVEKIKLMLDNYGFQTQIIVSAVRHPMHVVKAALIGAHVTTMRFEIMKQLFEHPLTDIGLKIFLSDWEKVPK